MGNSCCAAPRAAGQEEGRKELFVARLLEGQSPGEWLAAFRAGPGAAAEAALGAPVAPTAAKLAAADADTLAALLTPECAAILAEHVPPAEFTNKALQQTSVELSWDEGETERGLLQSWGKPPLGSCLATIDFRFEFCTTTCNF